MEGAWGVHGGAWEVHEGCIEGAWRMHGRFTESA